MASANVIPQLLWDVLVRRLGTLGRQERSLDLIALHRRYWRGVLEGVVQDTAALELVVDAYTQAGLDEQAIRTQREIFVIQTRLGTSLPRDLLRLAELYQAADRHDDALRTLDFIAGQGVPKELRGRRLRIGGSGYGGTMGRDKRVVDKARKVDQSNVQMKISDQA